MKDRDKRRLARKTSVARVRRTRPQPCVCPTCNGRGTIPSTRDLEDALDLTPREAQVVQALLRGRTVQNICEELSVSRGTAKTYVRRAYRKLEVEDRQELAVVVHAAFET